MSLLELAFILKIFGYFTVGASILYALIASILKKKARIGCLIFIVALIFFALSTHFEDTYMRFRR